jgi:hypothetical protein
MKIELLQPEPHLEFGNEGKCPDMKFGIGHFGTFDCAEPDAPGQIRIGLVGTDETVNALADWLDKCRREIPAKPSNQPYLYPPFPGFAASHGFHSELVWNSNEFKIVKIPNDIRQTDSFNKVVEKVVNLYLEQITELIEKSDVKVILCAPSLEHLRLTSSLTFGDEEDAEERDDENSEDSSEDSSEDTNETEDTQPEKSLKETVYDFHDLLKAKSLFFRTPLQIVLPSTYDESKQADQKKIFNREQQDEATRAWNLHTAIYYKARGIPWRMARETAEISTCYLGVSFFLTLDKQKIYASSAQVFNERGEGVIVRGGLAYEDKQDRQIHLDKDGAYNLISLALQAFWKEHYHYPARVVIHKTSSFSKDELEGFNQFLHEKGIELIDFVYLRESFTRLFRPAKYPPLRGTFWHVEDRRAILYTRGSVYFYETYPGIYPPRSLYLDCTSAQKTAKEIARECLALSKMNWNNTRLDGHLPITLRAARQVGKILKYLSSDEIQKISPSYRFYM